MFEQFSIALSGHAGKYLRQAHAARCSHLDGQDVVLEETQGIRRGTCIISGAEIVDDPGSKVPAIADVAIAHDQRLSPAVQTSC